MVLRKLVFTTASNLNLGVDNYSSSALAKVLRNPLFVGFIIVQGDASSIEAGIIRVEVFTQVRKKFKIGEPSF